jgi:hypothetical protein
MRASLGTLLIQAGVASDTDVKNAIEEGQQTGERLGEIVIRKGLATDELIAKLLAEQWELPYTTADQIEVDDVAALRISSTVARELAAKPIAYDGDKIVMAISEPRTELFAEVAKRVGEAVYVVVSRSTLESLLGGPFNEVYEDEPEEIDAGRVNGTVANASEAETEDDDSEGEPEQVAPEPGTVGEGSSAVEGEDAGNDSGFETSLASIDTALEEFDRLRGVTAGLGDVLRVLREQLVRQQGTLATVQEARARDQETIQELEAALATRDELFETLRQQTSALSATLTDGAPSR